MKKVLAVSGLTLAIAGGVFALQFWGAQQEPDLAGNLPSNLSEKQSARPTANAGTVDLSESNTTTGASTKDEKLVDFEAIKRRFNVDHDPMIIIALGEFSDAEIAAYNELHIIPFNRATGTDCREEVNQFIPGEFVAVCETIRERPPHPYEALDTEELVGLAESDGAAALILGQRTRDAEQRLDYYLRAAALSGKSGPLVALAEKRYSSFADLERDETGKLQRIPRPDNLVNRLALETLAAEMGDPRANPERWRNEIQNQTNIDPVEALVESSKRASEWLSKMRGIQQQQGVVTNLEGSFDA